MQENEMNEYLSEIIENLMETVNRDTINLWLGKAYVSSFDGRNITITCENEFKKNTVIKRYNQKLEDEFQRITGKRYHIIVTSKEEVAEEEANIFTNAEKPFTVEKEEKPGEEAEEGGIGSGFTFENFVVGSSNQVAQSACLAVASKPAVRINPLFLYGPSGLGKTHLLFAIMNEVKKNRPRMKILYVTGEQFTNEIIDAITTKNTVSFRDKYRNLDMLLVDDIQFIAGKMAVQEEFFHTFDTLYRLQKQIVLTSDKTPKDIDLLEERLRTRFEMGLIVDIQPPEAELRTAIFKQKTMDLGLDLPNDVLTYLAENIRSNVRQIEGAVKKLWAQSFISNEPITLDMARNVLSDYFSDERRKITPENIFSILEKRYGILREDMIGKRRSADIVYARHIAIYLIQEYTELSLMKTGRLFDRDHSTIISARDNVVKRMKSDASFNKEITEIKAELEKK